MISLPDLPYSPDALAPVISAETLRFHHGKHHRAYVDTLNKLLAEAGIRSSSLEAIVRDAADNPAKAKLFNNAAQAWNHGFFWQAMSPDRTTAGEDLAWAIDAAFGSLANLRAAFVKAGVEQFGSGWVWLIAEGDRLSVVATHDAANPLPLDHATALTVCDLWEHAYYLDHQNDRKGFLEAWFDRLLNWDLASAQFDAARGRGLDWRYPEPLEVAGTVRQSGR